MSRPAQTILYFVQCNGDDGPIKIGTTENLFTRLRIMRTNNPFPLQLLYDETIDSASAVERRLLHALRPHRVCGEWFKPEPVFEWLRERVQGCDFPLLQVVKDDINRDLWEESRWD